MAPSSNNGKFVVTTPARSVCDDNARALENHGLLRFIALGTRKGTRGVPPERTRLKPAIGLAAYIAARTLSSYHGESFRFRLHPWLDHWVKGQLTPGDHIISSYGYANACFRWVRKNGGKTFLDGGNSHPENFWNVIAEEHRRWNCPYPPVGPHWKTRAVAMMEDVDYVLAPSTYVANSFLERGFKKEQILQNIYPVDLSCFSPSPEPRPRDRPLSLISTGSLSLRKGTPYLLEAFRLVSEKIPNVRLMLTSSIQESVFPILKKYADLPIDWAPSLPHAQLAERLRRADIFLLPSLEEGLARTSLEALACGLPIIVTSHTGSNDFVVPETNGEVVPIRDPAAIAEAVFKWADRILAPDWQPLRRFDTSLLSFERFEKAFILQLQQIGLA